jgi:hypothetical protein
MTEALLPGYSRFSPHIGWYDPYEALSRILLFSLVFGREASPKPYRKIDVQGAEWTIGLVEGSLILESTLEFI